jgi:hypothetical protein
MYMFRDYHGRIDRFICSRSRKAFVLAWLVVAAALALLAAVFWRMGAPPFNGLASDNALFLDGGWRILNGQAPHKDFYFYIGDLPLYVAWLGMKLGRPGMSALTCGNVFVMVAAGFAAMTLLGRRTSAFYACAFALFIALLAVAPRPLGDPHYFTSYAMLYNRYGEALLALMGALLFLAPEPERQQIWADWVEAGFVGFCLALLTFCKLTYFLVGVGFFVLACLRGRFPLKQAFFGILSGVAFFSMALILTKIPFSGLYGDYRIMMATQKFSDRLPRLAVQTAKGVIFLLILLLLACEISRKQNKLWAAWPHFLLVAVLFGSETMLVTFNCQTGELPLLALAALYCAETIRRQRPDTAEDGFFIAVRNSGAALLLLFFLLPTLAEDLKSVRYSARVTAQGQYLTSETLRSTRLNDLRFCLPGSRSEETLDYMATVDEGIQLLRRHANPQMRLQVFLFSNPYQVALGLPPAQGGVVCWSWVGMAESSHPPLERLVGNATHILAGCGPDIKDEYGAICRPSYGTEWDALHLEVVEQTKHFTLFKLPERGSNKP